MDAYGAPNLVTLDLSYNKITRLDLRNFKKLTNFTANHNTILATVLFPDGSTELRNIDMSDGDITHFYPVSLYAFRDFSKHQNSFSGTITCPADTRP